MMTYRMGDPVFLKAGARSLEEDNDWVVVHIEGSALMLKRGHLVICGIHADQVRAQSGVRMVARWSARRPVRP